MLNFVQGMFLPDVENPWKGGGGGGGGGLDCAQCFLQHNGPKKHIATVVLDYSSNHLTTRSFQISILVVTLEWS